MGDNLKINLQLSAYMRVRLGSTERKSFIYTQLHESIHNDRREFLTEVVIDDIRCSRVEG